MRTRAPSRGCGTRRPASRLDQEGLVIPESLQGADDGVERLEVPRSLAPPSIHDQLLGVLGDIGVEVVQQATATLPPGAIGC